MTKLTDFISEVRGRLEAATPGPWYSVSSENDMYYETEWNKNQESYTVSPKPDASGWCTDSGYPSYCISKKDSEFIAACPTDIAKLLRIVEIYHEAITYFLGPTRDFKEPKLRQALALAEKEIEK